MYVMGNWKEYKRDPGIRTAVSNFFTNGENGKIFYDSFIVSSGKADIATQKEEAEKLIAAKGLYATASQIEDEDKRREFLHNERNKMLAFLAKKDGWADQWRAYIESQEGNRIFERNITAQCVGNLTSILDRLGDFSSNQYCSVFIEVPKDGDFKVNGRYFSDARNVPKINTGQKVAAIAYGRDAEKALDRVESMLNAVRKESLLEHIANSVMPNFKEIDAWGGLAG